MPIAASGPRCVKPEDVTIEDLEREKEPYRARVELLDFAGQLAHTRPGCGAVNYGTTKINASAKSMV
jgi:translation elongation factor EF-Ts